MAKTKKTKKAAKRSRILTPSFSVPELLLFLAVFSVLGALFIFISRASTNNSINPTDEKNQISRINSHRTNTHSPSRGSVDRTGCLTDIARNWSQHMQFVGGIHHNSADWHQEYGTSGYIKDPRTGNKTGIKYHTHGSYAASKISAYCSDDWNVVGENVGAGPSERSLFDAFLGSSGHHSNIHYDSFNFVGVGDFVDSDGTHWITQLYAACRTSSGSKCGGKWSREPSDTCAVKAPSDGMLFNGSFELPDVRFDKKWNDIRDTNTWYSWRTDGDNIDRANGAHGDCYSIYNRDIEDGAVATTQIVRGEPGKSYTLSAWYKYGAHGGNQTLYLDFLDSNWNRIERGGNPHTVSTTQRSSWGTSPLSVTATSPSGTYYIRVILYGSNSAGASSNFYWDDVRLVKN